MLFNRMRKEAFKSNASRMGQVLDLRRNNNANGIIPRS